MAPTPQPGKLEIVETATAKKPKADPERLTVPQFRIAVDGFIAGRSTRRIAKELHVPRPLVQDALIRFSLRRGPKPDRPAWGEMRRLG